MSDLIADSCFPIPSYLQYMLSQNIIRRDQWRVLLNELEISPHKDMAELLVSYGFISENDLLKIRSNLTSFPIINLQNLYLEPDFIDLVNTSSLKNMGCVAFMRDNHFIHVGMLHPENVFHQDSIKEELSKALHIGTQEIQLRPYYITKEDFQKLSRTSKQLFLLKEEENAPIKLENILELAIHAGASDIHFHPHPHYVRILFRLDGVIKEMVSFHISEYPAYLNRLKLLSKLDIGECRRPQSGSFLHEMGMQSIDIRTSFHPTVHGESIVLRLLDTHKTPLKLEELGLFDADIFHLKKLIQEPQGLIILSGPTGSGKTTTLYSMLFELDIHQKTILTLEQPVEYTVQSIRQTEIPETDVLDFKEAMRSVLRQDPDVLLIGEIRDEETAQMAIRASLTGHLVLATLHAMDASSIPLRLHDLGVDNSSLKSCLLAGISQRLVRTICKKCNNSGCIECHGTGYKGRTVILECHEFNPDDFNTKGCPNDFNVHYVKTPDIQEKIKYLLDCKLTTPEEILRVYGPRFCNT